MRDAIKGAGGSVSTEKDGSRWFTLHGLLVAIRGQKFVDGNGQITTVDTRRFKYDKNTRLATSYTRVSRDSQGNTSVTLRSDIKYTKDSSEHGHQIVTDYTDTNIDPNGNVSIVKRDNVTYLDL